MPHRSTLLTSNPGVFSTRLMVSACSSCSDSVNSSARQTSLKMICDDGLAVSCMCSSSSCDSVTSSACVRVCLWERLVWGSGSDDATSRGTVHVWRVSFTDCAIQSKNFVLQSVNSVRQDIVFVHQTIVPNARLSSSYSSSNVTSSAFASVCRLSLHISMAYRTPAKLILLKKMHF